MISEILHVIVIYVFCLCRDRWIDEWITELELLIDSKNKINTNKIIWSSNLENTIL